jgi:hypothetical protein
MRKKTISILFVALLAFVSMNFVCTQSQEKKAAQLADAYAHSIAAIHASVDAAYTAGKISDADYQAILKDILTADQGGLDLNTAIRGIADGTSTTAQVNAAISAIEAALTDGTAHIKDPTTLQGVQAAVAAINLTLTSIESIYQIVQQGGTS